MTPQGGSLNAPLNTSIDLDPELLFTRRGLDGDSWPVRIFISSPSNSKRLKHRFELVRPEGQMDFDTFSALRQEIHGPTTYATWSVDRYFVRGGYAAKKGSFGQPGLKPRILTIGESSKTPKSTKKTSSLRADLQNIVTAPWRAIPAALTILMPRRIGVDLKNRHQEIAKLLYAGFGNSIRTNGYDFDDVLQEVFRKLLASNQGTKPWNPDRSSFGHFVHMVCRSALFNYHRKKNRIKAHEQIGLKGRSDGGFVEMDAGDERTRWAQHGTQPAHPNAALRDLQAHLLAQASSRPSLQADATLAADILPLVREGYGRGEIARIRGLKPNTVSKALAYMRTHAASWG